MFSWPLQRYVRDRCESARRVNTLGLAPGYLEERVNLISANENERDTPREWRKKAPKSAGSPKTCWPQSYACHVLIRHEDNLFSKINYVCITDQPVLEVDLTD
jgi:hypothetical protein